jgi:replicative DNA helicase
VTELMHELSVPRDESAERALLGCFMNWPETFYECHDVRLDDYYLDSHQKIHTAIAELSERDIDANVVTLANHLGAQGRLQAVGGVAYLASLTENRPIKMSVQDYKGIVKEAAKRRRILDLSTQTAAAASEGTDSSAEISASWEENMMRIIDDRITEDPLVATHIVTTLNDVFRDSVGSQKTDVTCGLNKLDVLTSGMQPGEVTVVGARSNVGKSSLLIQAALKNSRHGIPSLIFSLEMTKKQIDMRILSLVSGVPFRAIRKPTLLSAADKDDLRKAADTITELPLRVEDGEDLTASQIASLSRMSIRRHGTRFIGVDYVQIVEGAGKDERTRVANVSRSLTRMIKHEDCSLMMLAQLRKMNQENYDKAPHISDLAETRQMENDAHVVLLLHRGWDAENGRISSDGQIVVAKNRSGETGTVNVGFDRNFVVFTE